MTDTVQLLPEGFYHVGDGRLSISDEYLRKLKTPKEIGEVYDVEETWIAKGMYGIVRSAISKQSGIGYAAKFLRRRRRGQCCLSEINHEIAVLMLCADSDHVVKLESVHETRSEVALILELATGGELQTLIDEQGQLSEQKTRVCMREILRALQHMHRKSIAHLDLKPQNILLAGKTVDDGLKLCDFGIARFIGEKNKIYEIAGTPDYIAPEVLHYNPLSLQTDIWSIGVLAYVLLTGLSPFGGDSKQETFLNVTKCSLTFPDDLFDGISLDAIDFIRSALRLEPKERMTVHECLEHRWLQEDTVCPIGERLAARATSCNWQGDETDTDDEASHDDDSSSSDQDSRRNGSYGVVVSSSSTPPPACLQSHNHHHQRQQKPSSTAVLVDEQEEKELPVEQQQQQQEVEVQEEKSEAEEDNKENVMVVQTTTTTTQTQTSRSLFPDAPTTPKVSRKTLPVEPLNDGLYHHYHHNHHNLNHSHHHLLHHHHHHHHHHVLHPNHLNQSASSSPPSVTVLPATGAATTNSSSSSSSSGSSSINGSSSTNGTALRHGSAASVIKYVQKFQIQEQILSSSAGGESCQTDGDNADVDSAAALLIAAPTGSSSSTSQLDGGAIGTTGVNRRDSDKSCSTSAVTSDISTSSNSSSSTSCTSFSVVGSGCRTTMALCGLKCADTSPGAGSRHLATAAAAVAAAKTLSPCDKDAIIC